MTLEEILTSAPVMPVVTLDDPAKAVALARALVAGGIRAIEVTMRTGAALEAVRAIARDVPEAIPGVGTVLTADHYDEAMQAGARFAISPGTTPALLAAVASGPIPYLPGVATASELMACLEAGIHICKFFPAADAGGVSALKSLGPPFPTARFCPTGGIDAASAAAYLALPNVLCVGGSWVVPRDAIAAGDFARIEQLAREAVALRRQS
ncbi:MAG TPA: bifunctional 4-hydroxy-2-oxoglutarate aldolase/2-dehydro-3-deoxy-phosphogluconate aldolase [Caulobacteraceae bacterium]|nr:bifunctional 4-hydroxy-2-oxoglutarate aldolase/2-dehydro-3-deoxy-phosphogluconate aldolase [Caulobacteraceae bacterium]